MTIHYDPKKRLNTIIHMKGSAWKDVYMSCIFTSVMTILIYHLRDKNIVDLSMNTKGHSFLSVLASFLLVERITIAVDQFHGAREMVALMFRSARRLSSKVAAYTKDDTSDQAQTYRNTIKRRLLSLVGSATYVIQNKYLAISIIEGIDFDEGKQAHIKTRAMDEFKNKNHRAATETENLLAVKETAKSLEDLKDPMLLALNLHAGIINHSGSISIQREMDLASDLNNFLMAYHNLTKITSTPFPFPLTQMSFTIIDVWIYTLPFALLSSIENEWACAALVFFITFGFVGINSIATELTHPTGFDLNDFEMNKYRDRTGRGIEGDLVTRFTNLDNRFKNSHRHSAVINDAFWNDIVGIDVLDNKLFMLQ